MTSGWGCEVRVVWGLGFRVSRLFWVSGLGLLLFMRSLGLPSARISGL